MWTVLSDHTHTPGGLGQTLENRSVVSAVLPDLFEKAKVAKLKPFFDDEHKALQGLETSSGEVSNLVFLTPGYHHPSYFEHAYKARLHGISLVEAADLTVRERRLFLKTLGGLRRMDGVICRLDDDGIDPLEFWTSGRGRRARSDRGVALGKRVAHECARCGFCGITGVAGVSAVDLPKVVWRAAITPFVESWWLGQQGVRDRMLGNLNGYVLLSAFGKDSLLPVKWAGLSAASRKQWLALIAQRPWDFVVQRDVPPSLVPSMAGRGVQPRPVVLRAFTLNGKDGQSVLPGGLARVGKPGIPPQLWPDHEGFTKDVWLTGKSVSPEPGINLRVPLQRDRLGLAPEVPSRIAEQLYWVGRYVERVETVARMLRVTLRCMEGESGRRQREQLGACLVLLQGSGVVSEDAGEMNSVAELAGLVFGKNLRGSLTKLVDSLIGNAASARDRISDDTWIIFNQLKNTVDKASRLPRATDLSHVDRMLLHLAAFSGMQAENMIRGQGWRFLETGRRIERGLCGLSLLRTASSDTGMLGAVDRNLRQRHDLPPPIFFEAGLAGRGRASLLRAEQPALRRLPNRRVECRGRAFPRRPRLRPVSEIFPRGSECFTKDLPVRNSRTRKSSKP